jgi:sigma-B regulation protein RsbU (phosphoserine phosphatase)
MSSSSITPRKPKQAKPPHNARPGTTATLEEPVEAVEQELKELRETVATLYAREALLDAVVQSLPIWVTARDINGRYLLVNQARAEASGLSPSQFVGKTAHDLPHAEKAELDAEDTLAHLVLTSGKPIERPSYVLKRPDGTEQVRRMIKLPLQDPDGAILGVIDWSEDITQRITAEAALDRNRRLLQALFEAIPHPLSYMDRGGKYRMVNRAWCETLGVAKEDVLDRTILDVETIPYKVRQVLWNESQDVFRTGKAPPPTEHVFPMPDGSKRYARISRAPLLVEDRVEGVVSLSFDLTAVRQAEEEAKLARQRLHDALESIPASIYLYDADDRLLLANSMAKSLYPTVAHLMIPGTPFAELVTGVSKVIFKDPEEQARFVERRLAEFRHIVRQVEQRGPGGEYLLGHDRRTTEGGTVSIRFDISEQKRIQNELERRERETRTELMLAAELQRQVLREVKPPPFLAAAHAFRPSSFVSGDVFHTGTTDDGSFLFFLGDATGHGVSAALVTMLVEATLTAMPGDLSPAEMAGQLNTRLLSYRMEGMYVSGVFLRIAPDGALAWANAGHPSALVLGRSEPLALESSGPPMGWFETPGYKSGITRLVPGDKVMLYTDGLTERVNDRGEQFGAAMVTRIAMEHAGHSPHTMVDALLLAADEHGAGNEKTDDLSLFVFEYSPRKTATVPAQH